MKHVAVFAALGAAILWLAFKPSTLDELAYLDPVANVGEGRNIFVEADPAKLPVTPAYFAVPGHLSVVVFHDKDCGACIALERSLVDFSRNRPDVAIRKVDIALDVGDRSPAYYTAIANYQWALYAAPTVLIYGADGKLIAADEKLT